MKFILLGLLLLPACTYNTLDDATVADLRSQLSTLQSRVGSNDARLDSQQQQILGVEQRMGVYMRGR